ncbi:MAG: phosphonate metabolism transcriptional regulator PhnF [Sedimentitalea sp.]
MPRTLIWKTIADHLTREIAERHYAPGDKLPTEAALATRFGVNRHTVRRALADLSAHSLVVARRGSGVFVAQTPTDYPIGRRVRFHKNLTAAGRVPTKSFQVLEQRKSNPREAEALGLKPETKVLVCEGLSFADDQPIALFRSVFPAPRFSGLLDDLAQTQSVTAALARHGVDDYTRTSTRLTAKQATATQALHLRIAEGAPILRSVGINVDEHNLPVELGHTWFVGDRVTLTLDETSGHSK